MSRRALAVVVLAVVLACTLLWLADPPLDPRDRIVVGFAGPKSGSQMQRAVELAVDDANAAGGVLGKRIRLEAGDDACDPGRAADLAGDFVAKGALAVFGHPCVDAALAATPVYAVESVLQFVPAATAPALTDEAAAKGWRQVFRVGGRDDVQGALGGELMAGRFSGRAVALLHDDSVHGRTLAEAARRAMRAAGLQEAVFAAYGSGTGDQAGLYAALRSAGVEAIYLAGRATQAAAFVVAARAQGLAAQFVACDAVADDAFVAATGAAGEGLIASRLVDPPGDAGALDVLARLTADGETVAPASLYGYAAVQLWLQAAAEAGSTDPGEVAAALRRGRFTTVLGPFSFDAQGDPAEPRYGWVQLRAGRFRPVGP